MKTGEKHFKETIMMRKIGLTTAVLLVALGLMMPVNMAFAKATIFYPPTSNVFGHKLTEWSAMWWQYVLSFPTAENPLVDLTGAECTIGQRGPVWFLMGSLGGPVTRTCSIPEGKALFFPVLNYVDFNVTSQTAAELRAEIGVCFDAAPITGAPITGSGGVTPQMILNPPYSVSVEVDGTPVVGWDKKGRIKSTVFEVTLPVNNLFGLTPGTYSPAIADGFYIMLKPLPVGPHKIHIIGQDTRMDIPACPVTVDVTYDLNIVPVDLD
jgi:hypothetical protein